MATFRIHEDQENSTINNRKGNAEVFPTAAQRHALGDLGQFACNQNRSLKLTGLSLVPSKVPVQDENRVVRQIKNEKNIVPPVAQFRAFSVYEDKPSECEGKKREPEKAVFKPFVAKDVKKENFFVQAAENVRALCAAQAQLDKLPERPKEVTLPRIPLQEKKDVAVESPMSLVHDSSVMSLSISKNDSQVLDDEDDEGDTTIAKTILQRKSTGQW